MSELTFNTVCFKKQIYPMVLNFQNENPSENFEFDCTLIQDEDGNKAIATESNGLLYAGNEETEDLGQTFLLARNRKPGKVRLIEAGRASLKAFSEYAAQELENSVSELDKTHNPHLRNTSKLNSNIRHHTPEKETNYELVKIHSQALEPSGLEPNVMAQNHQQLQASELEPKGPNPSPLSEQNEVEPNRLNHLQSLETSELESDGTKHSPLLKRSKLKLKTKEFNLRTLNDDKDFSTEKMLFVRALGLNIKSGETVYSENNVHSSPANDKQRIYEVPNAPGSLFIRQTRVMTRRMHLEAHKSINDTIIIRKSRMITNENGPTQEHKEIEILHSANHQPKDYCEDNKLEINITTDKSCEARNSSVRNKNNAERTITVMVAEMKNSNKKSTADGDDNTFIYNDCGRKSKRRLSLITHIKYNNSSVKAMKNVTLFPHIKLGVKEHSMDSNTEAKEGITLKLPFIKLTKCDLLNHINEKLASEKKKKICTLCKYTTPYASRLTRHKLAHTKAFKCKHCKKGFRKSNDLKLHLRCHSGDRPHQCRCGAAFAKKNTLNRHLKTHTGEKSYNCAICSSKFKLLNGLKRHLKIHGEKTFKCTSCESSFSDGSSLKRHIKRHTGEKPYGCDSCKYSTANGHDLKRHAKTCQGRCRRARQL